METRERNASSAIVQRYLDAAPRGSFFALVAYLERIAAGSVRPGEDGPPAREAILFRHSPDLGFASADVQSLQTDTSEDARFEVTSMFLGLTGPVSPLPSYLVEGVLFDAERGGTQRDFLDVFHHRMLSLLYRARMRLDPAREHRSDASDPWLLRLLGLAGVHQEATMVLEPKHLMRIVPVLLKTSRGAEALRVAVQSVLSDELPDVDVSVREFVGCWIDLDEDQQTRLGRANHGLGSDMMLGSRVYDQRGRFALRLSTLSRPQAEQFAEGGPLRDRVRATVALVLRDPLEYDLELELDAGSARALTIGVSRLGKSRLTGFQGTEVIRFLNVGRMQGANRSLV